MRLQSLLAVALASTVVASPTMLIIEASSKMMSSDSVETQDLAAGAAAAGACSQAVTALAQGISDNIADQNNEVATVTALGNILSQNPVDNTLYSATQSSLLGFVTKGIAIRQNNQKIAPAGNAALTGLATVATAQMTELNLTMSLAIPASGQLDTTAANTTVESLKGDFAGGIEQNKKNLAAAQGNCTAVLTAAAGSTPVNSTGAATPSAAPAKKDARSFDFKQ